MGAGGRRRPCYFRRQSFATLFCVAVEATQLLFYNANTGGGASGVVDHNGAYSDLQGLGFAAGWTHITNLGGGQLLFYNADTGGGASGVVDHNGAYSDLQGLGFAAGWTHIT